MKNFFLLLFVALMIPQMGFSQDECKECMLDNTNATADILEDPCIVWFDVHYFSTNNQHIFNSDCTNLTFSWAVDGVDVSGPSSSTDYFHEFENNGTYTGCVTITALSPGGVPCEIEKCVDIEITGCGDCCDFYMNDPIVFKHPSDPCTVALVGSQLNSNDECADYNLSWEVNGVFASNSSSFITTLVGPGPHTACLTMSNQAGDCEYTKCSTFDLPDCPELGNCDECVLDQFTPTADNLPGCNTWFDMIATSSNGNTIYNSDCTDLTFEWDYGDTNGSGPLSNPSVFYSYEDNGTYTACLTITAVNSDGGDCTETKCIDVVIDGCGDCCDFFMGTPIVFQNPWNPCVVAVIANSPSSNDACSDFTLNWTLDGNPAGTGNSIFTTTTGQNHTACVTMASGSCTLTQCVDFTLPNCPGFTDGGGDDSKSFNNGNIDEFSKKMILAPNPAKDFINVRLVQNELDPINVVSILSTSGQVIRTENTNMNTALEMDISSLPYGVYFIQAVNQNGGVTTEKFVKIK